jgi:hypothetical protein
MSGLAGAPRMGREGKRSLPPPEEQGSPMHSPSARIVFVASILATACAAQARSPNAAKAAEAVAVPSRVEFVAMGAAPARRPEHGLLVLDLQGMESPDSALAMAQHWRQRLDGSRPLICWLRSADRTASADAVAALTQSEAPPCSRILVPN